MDVALGNRYRQGSQERRGALAPSPMPSSFARSMLFLLLVACRTHEVPHHDPDDPDDPVVEETPPSPTFPDASAAGSEPDGVGAFTFTGVRPRNLLMISIDTTRRDMFTRYRSDAGPLPFLDGLMAEGVVLDHHASCSAWTLPGAMCALTGNRPDQLGLLPRVDGTDDLQRLPADSPTFSSRLADLGYRTFLLQSNLYFDESYLAGEYEYSGGGNEDAAAMVTDALRIIGDSGIGDGDPWMFHLHLSDPHSPYAPPMAYRSALADRPRLDWDLTTSDGSREVSEAWDELDAKTRDEVLAQLQILYEGELSYVDDQLARLLGVMDNAGLLDDTLVLVWTDHGEQMFEHGSLGHGGSLFAQENDGVAFWWARGLEPAAVSDLTTNEDLLPTTFFALGLPAPEGVTGRVAGIPSNRIRLAYLWPSEEVPVLSAQSGSDQLYYTFAGRTWLFDRDTDPQQQSDRYDPTDPVVAELWDALLPVVGDVAALSGEEPLGAGR